MSCFEKSKVLGYTDTLTILSSIFETSQRRLDVVEEVLESLIEENSKLSSRDVATLQDIDRLRQELFDCASILSFVACVDCTLEVDRAKLFESIRLESIRKCFL